MIDRLLASPHYGERWGRHWLDVVRFAESHGYENDHIRDNAWPYRDYVIQSLNADRPYPRFVREQIAGDVLEPATREGIIATGFLVAGDLGRGEPGRRQSSLMRQRAREEELEDMVAAVGQVFLGLTVNCARCHDHKFDPVPQRDYYRIKAAIEGVQHGNRPIAPGSDLNAKGLPLTYAARPSPAAAHVRPGPRRCREEGQAGHRGRALGGPASLGGVRPGRRCTRRSPVAASSPNGSPIRTIRSTARVIVNRVWHYHFGTGLVATPNDFGRNGERPSHPELLDWLASDFLAQGSRLKALHRRIMLSSTYRQSSRFDAKAAAVDADDRLLWRYPARRLEAEAIRDAMLQASGQLNTQMAGPSFRPFKLTVFNSNFYELNDPVGPEFNRRTVYRININSAKDPLLETLDCPDPSVKTPRRAVTTTPLQALGLMNDSFVLRQARCLADRVRRGVRPRRRRAGRTGPIGSRWGGRRPTAKSDGRADLLDKAGLENLAWVLFNSSEFLYFDRSDRLRDPRSIDGRSEPRIRPRPHRPQAFPPRCRRGPGSGRALLDAGRGGRGRTADRVSHFPARAKRVMQIFACGGVSHVDTFDYKPELARHRRAGAVRQGEDRHVLRQPGRLMKSPFAFRRHGESGQWVSDLLPHLAECVDDLTFIRSMVAKSSNHTPATFQMNTGFTMNGFPCLGAWLSYGLGIGEPGPADLRRAARSARPAGRRLDQLDLGLPAGHPSGRRVPHDRRADRRSVSARRRSRRRTAARAWRSSRR